MFGVKSNGGGTFLILISVATRGIILFLGSISQDIIRLVIVLKYRNMRNCMVMWATTKAGYKEFAKSSFWTYPKPCTLKKLHTKMRVNEGSCLRIYSWLGDELADAIDDDLTGIGLLGASTEHRGWITGQILADEMDLIDDVALNPLTNQVVGFVVKDSTFSLSKEMIDLLKDDVPALDDEKGKEEGGNLAKQVNQFVFRTTYGESRRIEFWFNHGWLRQIACNNRDDVPSA